MNEDQLNDIMTHNPGNIIIGVTPEEYKEMLKWSGLKELKTYIGPFGTAQIQIGSNDASTGIEVQDMPTSPKE